MLCAVLILAGYHRGPRLLAGVIGIFAGFFLVRLAARSARPFLRGVELFGLVFLPALELVVLSLAIAGLREIAAPLVIGFLASVAAIVSRTGGRSR